MASNSLTQYLDLYEQAGAELRERSPEPLNALRPAALDALRAFGRLPKRGDEGYEKTDMEAIFAPDYGVNITGLRFPVDVQAAFRCEVPAVSTLLAVVDNDVFVPTERLLGEMPRGVEVMSLAEAARTMPEVVSRYLNGLADNATAASALNTLLCHDGVLVRVTAGIDAVAPVQVINILNAAAEMMAVRRVLIIVEPGAHCRMLMCDHSQNPGVRSLSLQVIEAYVGEDATLDLYDVEEADSATDRVCELYASVEANGHFNTNFSTLSGGNCRNNYNVVLAGCGSQATLNGMVIGNGKRLVDNASMVRHASPRAKSDQLFKYALFEQAHGAFEGSIRVDHGAHHTEAYQANRNLLASSDARMHTKPQLEIYCDDVKCSHGATTGQLDAQALFYMRSRGIPEAEARMMLIRAFMVDVIDSIALGGLRDRMHNLVAKRLEGREGSCADCQTATKQADV